MISTKELIDRGQLADFEIKCLVLKYPEEECKKLKGADYQAEIDFLVSHTRRNNFLANLAKKLDGNTLILYTLVDKHGKPLYDLVKEKCADRPVHFVYGKTDVLMREEIRRLTEKETNSVIVASYGTFSTGVNIRNLHNVIFASPTKSQIRTLQSIGRGLRLGENKSKAVLYDVSDDLRHKSYVNYTLNHYKERVKIYNAEKFPIKTYNIGL
jgi:superfamily II DNA or RNA helicase